LISKRSRCLQSEHPSKRIPSNAQELKMTAKKKNTPRATSSRSKEFDLMFGYLKSPEILQNVMSSKHLGARESLEGIVFEFGKITRFRKKIDVSRPVKPFDVSPVYIGHVDSIPANRKRELEIEFKLPEGTLVAADVKVDLMIIDSDLEPYLISFKDGETTAKLGQVSRRTSYGDVFLEGGIDPSVIGAEVPENLAYTDTSLTSKGFKSITRQNRQFAWLKKKHPKEWQKYASTKLHEAYLQVDALGLAMQSDHETFFQFLEKTLAGNLATNDDFYLVVGDQPLHFRSVMDRLRKTELSLDLESYQVQRKKSLVINVSVDGTKYCITKIEPSFEGAGKKVLQTKGVVFHFQQHMKTGNHYKQFLFDIAK
jgi:hypothetical protein